MAAAVLVDSSSESVQPPSATTTTVSSSRLTSLDQELNDLDLEADVRADQAARWTVDPKTDAKSSSSANTATKRPNFPTNGTAASSAAASLASLYATYANSTDYLTSSRMPFKPTPNPFEFPQAAFADLGSFGKPTFAPMNLKMDPMGMYSGGYPGSTMFPQIPTACPMDMKTFLPFGTPPLLTAPIFPMPQPQAADETERRYIEQLQRFPRLPLDAHRKICQMGNEIIHYFEARLIHVENPNSVGTFDAHIVFLKSPSTAQHWVMAFVKEQNRVLVKFNRLLTVHVKVSMQNPLTIDIEPSKSPNRRNDEQFIFNFENQRVCAEFLRVLNICKKEVWTRRGLPSNGGGGGRQSRSAIPSSSSSTSRSNLRGKPPKVDACELVGLGTIGEMDEAHNKIVQAHGESPVGSGSSSNNNGTLSGRTDAAGSVKKSGDENPAPPKFLRFPYRMKFMLKHSVVLCVRKDKKSTEYGTLGIGTLKIWGNDDCFDQLDFIARHTNDLICSHPIYSWNAMTLTSDEERREFSCVWTAAADILAAPTSLPTVREFRVVFPTVELATSFKTAFDESCAKASRPEIIFKSNQMAPQQPSRENGSPSTLSFNSLF